MNFENLTLGSKEVLFLLSSSSTLWRISVEMFLASNVAISSFTPRLARKLQKKNQQKITQYKLEDKKQPLKDMLSFFIW